MNHTCLSVKFTFHISIDLDQVSCTFPLPPSQGSAKFHSFNYILKVYKYHKINTYFVKNQNEQLKKAAE